MDESSGSSHSVVVHSVPVLWELTVTFLKEVTSSGDSMAKQTVV